MKRKILWMVTVGCLLFTWQTSASLFVNGQKYLQIFTEVFALVKSQYVKDVPDKKLIEGAISGMLTSLDPYSAYLDEQEYEEIKFMSMGEFQGVGLEIMIDNGLKIIAPIEDTPAYLAGIQTGDVILSIDNEPVAKMTPSGAIAKIKGQKGSKVKLTIAREGVDMPLEFILTREVIKINSVKWHLYDDVAYIRISSFVGKTTANNVKKAMYEMKKEAVMPLKGFVLDLRGNPGGILEQSIYVTQLFLKEGVVVSTRGRNEKDNQVYEIQPDNIADESNLVVLINGGSASASEIVAGALQDNKRATIMGTKSFGKASVQTIFPLKSLNAGARITTAQYYTPSGRLIQKEGIIPDIIIEPEKIADEKQSELDQTKKVEKKLMTAKEIIEKRSNWNERYKIDIELRKAADFLRKPGSSGRK